MYLQRVLDGHTRSRCGLSGEKSLWDPAGKLGLPFAGRARSHKGLAGYSVSGFGAVRSRQACLVDCQALPKRRLASSQLSSLAACSS